MEKLPCRRILERLIIDIVRPYFESKTIDILFRLPSRKNKGKWSPNLGNTWPSMITCLCPIANGIYLLMQNAQANILTFEVKTQI